jgi:phosphoserine phosphatase RsbU/P
VFEGNLGMNVPFLTILVDLIKTAAVVVVFAYLVTRTRFFANLLDRKISWKGRLFLILIFGVLSIFGTYGGLQLPSGAIANIRDLGPVIAGLVGGPVVGLGAGLIGGIHRYFLGGFVAVPCSLATVIAGLLGGLVYTLMKGNLPRVWQVMIISGSMELLHMGLTLAIARPFDQALDVVKSVTAPMIAANAVSAGIFAYIINNLVTERKTAAEKEKYRGELERKKFEIETARNIQQSFLPEVIPTLNGFDLAAFSLPALEVGGDFYDFIPISKDRWGFVIADVSGKGFPAALFMALSRTCVRANAMGKTTAAEAICMANNLISQDAKSGMFVTLFYAMLDLSNRQLHYVNAGHNPPMMFKDGNSNVVMLGAKGIALGVMDEICLQEIDINLTGNETLVFYTDGVTEAINNREEQFGVERLSKLIAENTKMPAGDLISLIKSSIIDFTRGQAQFDDITLMVLKSNEAGA